MALQKINEIDSGKLSNLLERLEVFANDISTAGTVAHDEPNNRIVIEFPVDNFETVVCDEVMGDLTIAYEHNAPTNAVFEAGDTGGVHRIVITELDIGLMIKEVDAHEAGTVVSPPKASPLRDITEDDRAIAESLRFVNLLPEVQMRAEAKLSRKGRGMTELSDVPLPAWKWVPADPDNGDSKGYFALPLKVPSSYLDRESAHALQIKLNDAVGNETFGEGHLFFSIVSPGGSPQAMNYEVRLEKVSTDLPEMTKRIADARGVFRDWADDVWSQVKLYRNDPDEDVTQAPPDPDWLKQEEKLAGFKAKVKAREVDLIQRTTYDDESPNVQEWIGETTNVLRGEGYWANTQLLDDAKRRLRGVPVGEMYATLKTLYDERGYDLRQEQLTSLFGYIAEAAIVEAFRQRPEGQNPIEFLVGYVEAGGPLPHSSWSLKWVKKMDKMQADYEKKLSTEVVKDELGYFTNIGMANEFIKSLQAADKTRGARGV